MASIVEIERMSFGWSDAHSVVLNIPRFNVAEGERLFVTGPSGSGKSTLLSLLAGVITPQRGELRVLGQNLRELRAEARDRFRADHIGYIFQMFNLLPYLSVIENIALPLRFSVIRRGNVTRRNHSETAEARRLLQHLGMDEEALLGRRVVELSVGQQQRVAAARALIGAPRLLIADEPTSALDTEHREAFIKLLFRECEEQGTTLIFVSHDRNLEPLFERSVEMAQLNPASGVPA